MHVLQLVYSKGIYIMIHRIRMSWSSCMISILYIYIIWVSCRLSNKQKNITHFHGVYTCLYSYMVKLGMVDPMVGFANIDMALGHQATVPGLRSTDLWRTLLAGGPWDTEEPRAAFVVTWTPRASRVTGAKRFHVVGGMFLPLWKILVSQLGVLFLIHEKRLKKSSKRPTR